MHFKRMPTPLPAGYQKTHLSVAMSRAYSMDNPVGDPFGGPAYGEKNGPAVAIMLPVFTMSATFTAMAAGSIMAGLAFAGSAMSLVGTLSGNQKLSKIGAVVGLVGGAGMAGMFGEAAQAATWGSTFGGAEAAASPATALSQTPSAGSGAPGAQTPVVEGMPTAATADLASPSASYAGGNINNPGAAAGSINAPGGATAPLNAAPAGSLDMFGSTGNAAADAALVSSPGPAGTATAGVKPGFFDSLEAGNYWDATKAAGSNIMDLTKSNPGAALMLGQAVGGLSDYLSGKTDAEIDALQAQIGFADARAMQIQEQIALEKQRRANLNAGYQQVNTGINVNPNASIQLPWTPPPQPQGLIAGNMPPRG